MSQSMETSILTGHCSSHIKSRHISTSSIGAQSFPQSKRVQNQPRRYMSEISRGTDLLADSLAFGDKRKIILEGYATTGFDVRGMVDFPVSDESASKLVGGEDKSDKSSPVDKSGEVHVNSSLIAFPHSCFLWRPTCAKEVTLDSLAIVALYKPSLEYLFIGCNKPLPPRELNKIKRDMKERGIVVDQIDVMNAMGTFNVLNGEDRRVAVALVLDTEAEE